MIDGLSVEFLKLSVVVCLFVTFLSRKIFTTRTNKVQAHNSVSFIYCMKWGSFINSMICGPSKIPALCFSMLSPYSLCASYSKHQLPLFKTYTNCFIRHRLQGFICSGGSVILPCTIKDSLITFCTPTIICSLGGQSFLPQSSCLALLFHV